MDPRARTQGLNLESFFEKFDLFADAPNAVAKMRKLILELEVRGNLVGHDPNDEPTNILLERIHKKARIINGKAIRRQDTTLILSDESPFSIPLSWVWMQLAVARTTAEKLMEAVVSELTV